jgi:hypothetical protein
MSANAFLNNAVSNRSLLLVVLLVSLFKTEAQQMPVQTIKGSVLDKSIKTPLASATIEWVTDNGKKVLTDASGNFKMSAIPVGRQNFRITHVGYKPVVLNNLQVESGKELVLIVEMEDEVSNADEILVQARTNKGKPINAFSMVSSRMFSVEETKRFAAGLNDPSRIAASFAGVSSAGDGNGLIIRGNAPSGLLWRMEGIDIPNPNHFARVGTSGGAISILSAQLLANSDFMTGAFPAEYGNAMSGVFDIRLRKGNKEKREHTFSLSTIGIDLATEGYFKKGYGGSYLVNYRYGFLSLMQKLGFRISEEATTFQDLSFNIHLPTRKMGDFSIFGFGGLSRQDNYLAKDSMEWQNDPTSRRGNEDIANTGAVGVSHQINIGKRSLLKTIYSINGFSYREVDKRLDKFSGPIIFTRNNRFGEGNGVLSSIFTHKFNKHLLLKTGIYTTEKSFDLNQREIVSNVLRDKIRAEGKTRLTNFYTQVKWDPITRLSFQGGIHAQYFSLNQKSVVEPRMGIKFMVAKGQALTIGMGLHSQTQPLGNYFARIKVGADTIMPNKSLDFSRARHFILGYTIQFNQHWNLRTEAYYQWLYQIPIHANIASTYSVINLDDDFAIEVLTNKGKGQNYGLEFTLDRFWNDRFYLLTTLSLYQSTYLPSEKIWRNTRYNSNSSLTFLVGKEWVLKTRRPSSLGLDIRLFSAGGVRATPIDLARSVALKTNVLIPGRIYEEKMKPIFRLDAQMEWKVQYTALTGSFILGVQNATNRKNQISRRYDPAAARITYSYLLGMIPVFGFRFDL